MTGLGAYLVEKLFVGKHVYILYIGISMKVADIIYVWIYWQFSANTSPIIPEQITCYNPYKWSCDPITGRGRLCMIPKPESLGHLGWGHFPYKNPPFGVTLPSGNSGRDRWNLPLRNTDRSTPWKLVIKPCSQLNLFAKAWLKEKNRWNHLAMDFSQWWNTHKSHNWAWSES